VKREALGTREAYFVKREAPARYERRDTNDEGRRDTHDEQRS
jgi:hypothetical protein